MKAQKSRNLVTIEAGAKKLNPCRPRNSRRECRAVWQETKDGKLILDPTSGLLVTAMRLWQDGRRNWHLISREFRATLGGEKGTWALGHFEAMMGAIMVFAKRPVNIARPDREGFSPDELMILRALAAIQMDEFDVFAIAMEGLFDAQIRSEPAVDMIALARLMGRCGVQIGNMHVQEDLYYPQETPIAAE